MITSNSLVRMTNLRALYWKLDQKLSFLWLHRIQMDKPKDRKKLYKHLTKIKKLKRKIKLLKVVIAPSYKVCLDSAMAPD